MSEHMKRRFFAVGIMLYSLVLPAQLPAGRDDWQAPKRVVRDMNIQPGWTVADVGCGKGYFAFRLAKAVGSEGTVLAADIDKKSLENLKGRAKKQHVTNIEIIRSEPTDCKLPPARADAALLCMVLHHARPEKVRIPLVASIAEGLKPGGYLFVIDLRKVKKPPFHKHDELVGRDAVMTYARDAGLVFDAEFNYLRYQYFLRFRKPKDGERGAAGPDGAPGDRKPVPSVQVIPLPHHRASFRRQGRELARYHFAPGQERPFWYPLIGPSGRSHTRMGHPHGPEHHGHHDSVWIAHRDVAGVNFWENRPDGGRVAHLRVEEYTDSEDEASMLTASAWKGPDGTVLMKDLRRARVRSLGGGEWLMLVDLRFEAPGKEPVVLGKTPFGIIGVRMAKTIGVHDGGGRILNAEGRVNEKAVFRRPAKWVDYSGPVKRKTAGGIALMDHPANVNHPAPFHVRGDGWMGACLTLDEPLTITPGKPLRLRYGLWVHGGVPAREAVEKQWKQFAKEKMPGRIEKEKKH